LNEGDILWRKREGEENLSGRGRVFYHHSWGWSLAIHGQYGKGKGKIHAVREGVEKRGEGSYTVLSKKRSIFGREKALSGGGKRRAPFLPKEKGGRRRVPLKEQEKKGKEGGGVFSSGTGGRKRGEGNYLGRTRRRKREPELRCTRKPHPGRERERCGEYYLGEG